MKIITRQEAQAQGLPKFFTGEPCRRGHVAERFTKYNRCYQCHQETNKRQHADDPEKIREIGRRSQNKHREAVRERSRLWKKNNPAAHTAIQQARHAQKLKAKPVWADENAILAFYEEAERLSRETGIKHNVDHIYPLRGKLCCGLHVENNLQILTASENCKKGNKMPDIPEASFRRT